jgi:uncharacterized protein
MRKHFAFVLLPSLLGCGLTCGTTARAQATALPSEDVAAIYGRLLPQVSAIKIFDNHSHIGFTDDPDVDAMTVTSDTSLPLGLRENQDEMVAAAKFLFGYPYSDLTPEHARWLAEKRAALRKTGGTAYFSHILDQLGVETALANRVAMPEYLDPARFRWVFFVDNFLFPFDNRQLSASNPDAALFFPLQEKVLHRNLAQARLAQLPADLSGYLSFVNEVLRQDKQHGAVALKFEAAYFRSLHFEDPPQERAAQIYEKYRAGGVPSPEEYTTFQDFVFRHLLAEAAQVHLAVHFHSSVGPSDYFNLQTGTALNLENVLRDTRYSSINFVLLHGGLPFQTAVIWLAARKNVYLDSSLMEELLYPEEFKKTLRLWLETFPEKIVFGSDAFPLDETMGVEGNYWKGIHNAREALAGALAEMVAAHEINEPRALEFAHAYLHDTAARLYDAAR